MSASIHPRLFLLEGLVEGLAYTAQQAAKAARKAHKERTRVPRGATLRPGTDTPLWNELATEARTLIRHYGEKDNLARFLGVPRQRRHPRLAPPQTQPAQRPQPPAPHASRRTRPRAGNLPRHHLRGLRRQR